MRQKCEYKSPLQRRYGQWFYVFKSFKVLSIFNMPVFSGFLFGLLLGWLGNFIEKTIYRKKRSKPAEIN